jgi:hypothetical protein
MSASPYFVLFWRSSSWENLSGLTMAPPMVETAVMRIEVRGETQPGLGSSSRETEEGELHRHLTGEILDFLDREVRSNADSAGTRIAVEGVDDQKPLVGRSRCEDDERRFHIASPERIHGTVTMGPTGTSAPLRGDGGTRHSSDLLENGARRYAGIIPHCATIRGDHRDERHSGKTPTLTHRNRSPNGSLPPTTLGQIFLGTR